MKFRVPIEAVIECGSETDALSHAKKIEQMLTNPMIKMTMQAQGVRVVASSVGKPTKQG